MKGKTLVGAVTNILHKRVTEAEAMKFALENYGVLATYIRAEFVESLKVNTTDKIKRSEKGNKKFFGSNEKIIKNL